MNHKPLPARPAAQRAAPPAAVRYVVQRPRVQTIEKTSKNVKGAMVIGVLMILAGFGFMVISSAINQPAIIGVLIAFAGIALYIGAKIIGWWNHG